MATKKEIAKQDTTDLAIDTRPDWMKDSNRGSENVTNNDITLPRLQIIQDLSPQHKKNKPEYIDGAEAGMVFNTVSNELYELPLQFIPVHYEVEYNIWKDQDCGGGFFGSYGSQSEAEAEVVRLVNEEGEKSEELEVVDTFVHYILIPRADDRLEEAVISMAKSQAKVSRKFNTIVKMAGGDRFSRVYTLGVVDDQNANGQEYYNFKISPKGFVGSKEQYERAEEVYEAINSGMRKIDRNETAGSTPTKESKPQEPDLADEDDQLDEF